ncbi:hypothetical protein LAV82_22600, partial [Bacillus sp. ILBB4]|nr:hypothetical protein [Bacillus sp. ILBB4]
GSNMKNVYKKAELLIEYLEYPEVEKGEQNPFTGRDPEQKEQPIVNSAKAEIPEEILPELVEFLHDKGVFVGHLRGVYSRNK